MLFIFSQQKFFKLYLFDLFVFLLTAFRGIQTDSCVFSSAGEDTKPETSCGESGRLGIPGGGGVSRSGKGLKHHLLPGFA